MCAEQTSSCGYACDAAGPRSGSSEATAADETAVKAAEVHTHSEFMQNWPRLIHPEEYKYYGRAKANMKQLET